MARRRGVGRMRRAAQAVSGSVRRAGGAARRGVTTIVERVRSGRRQARSEGLTVNIAGLKTIAEQTFMSAAGGAASAIYDGVAKTTSNKIDDDPLYSGLIKGGIGVGVRFLMGNRARDFVSGMNGHTAGATLERFVVNKVVAAVSK